MCLSWIASHNFFTIWFKISYRSYEALKTRVIAEQCLLNFIEWKHLGRTTEHTPTTAEDTREEKFFMIEL